MLTTEQRRKIQAAIVDCDRYIAKEGPRDPKLRPEWAQRALDHSIDHRAKLERALENNNMDELRLQGGK